MIIVPFDRGRRNSPLKRAPYGQFAQGFQLGFGRLLDPKFPLDHDQQMSGRVIFCIRVAREEPLPALSYPPVVRDVVVVGNIWPGWLFFSACQLVYALAKSLQSSEFVFE